MDISRNWVFNFPSFNFGAHQIRFGNSKKISKNTKIEKLKILVRDLNDEDISKRDLPKNTKGVVVTEILSDSPLAYVLVNDVIVELQKKKVLNSGQFSKLTNEIINKGAKTLYLAIFNSSNQRSYITVKLK